MPVYDNKFIFLHIPKTGGTIIEKSLKKDYKESYYGVDRSVVGVQPKQHLPFDKLISNFDKKNVFSFTFVRNPFDRILSSYLNYPHQDKMPDFDKYIDMVKNVVENKLYLTQGFIGLNDISHFIPMTIMIGNNELDFIGRFENFDNDIKKLHEISGIKNIDKIKIKKSNENYQTFYSERNKKIVSELYADDLKKFDYTF
tara:strand:- start:820 stop:1416 length:597 start_codon:yes stop_codon:yes gene_type:complete